MNMILEYLTEHWLEITAVATGIVAIFLASRQNVITFVLGLVNSALFTWFYYYMHLYSASVLHAGYFVINLYGIAKWCGFFGLNGDEKVLRVSRLSWKNMAWLLGAVLVSGVGLGLAVMNMPSLLPDAQYPILDACTTTASVVAQILMTRKKIETWWAWIIIDLINAAIYFNMGIWLNGGLHIVYIGIAVSAILRWQKDLEKEVRN